MTDAPDRFETVAYVYSQSDLALLLALFESEDIYVFGVGRCHASVDWALTVALGGVELRVHAEDAVDARAVLAGLDPWPYRGRLLTGIFAVDLAFLVLALFVFAIPPPARMPPCFVPDRAAAARRDA